jgi:hypothetical protein
MLIKNNRERVLRVFEPSGRGFILVPGVNQLDARTWEYLKTNRNFAKDVEREHVTVLTEEEPSSKSSQISVFRNVREAFDIIRATFDVALLNSWKVGEERGTIIKAIDEQLAKLERNKQKALAKAKAIADGATDEGDGSEDENMDE